MKEISELYEMYSKWLKEPNIYKEFLEEIEDSNLSIFCGQEKIGVGKLIKSTQNYDYNGYTGYLLGTTSYGVPAQRLKNISGIFLTKIGKKLVHLLENSIAIQLQFHYKDEILYFRNCYITTVSSKSDGIHEIYFLAEVMENQHLHILIPDYLFADTTKNDKKV